MPGFFCKAFADQLAAALDQAGVAVPPEEAEALAALRARLPDLAVQQWQQNSSEGDSLYLLDPDGHRLELHCGSLQTRLRALEQSPYSGLIWHSKPAHE